MTAQADDVTRVPEADIASFIHRVLAAVGLRDADARVVGELMAEGDLNGADTHGVFRLPQYVKRIETGGINPAPDIRVEREQSAMALVNGDNGMGHLVAKFAADLAVEKARHSGVAWVGINHGNHSGPASIYAKIPMRHDMVGIYVATGNGNHLPPWGGTELLLGTNPIAIAVPALDEPDVVLDMATTVAAFGKVKTALQRGETMPEGWMIGRDGMPLTDPAKAGEGFLLPIGGPKGYGLSLMFALLGRTLNGCAVGRDIVDPDTGPDPDSTSNPGQFIVAVDIAAFGGAETFKRAVDKLIRDIKSSPTLPGFDEILLPGEQSHRKRLDREKNGIPIRATLMRALDKTADEVGVARLR